MLALVPETESQLRYSELANEQKLMEIMRLAGEALLERGQLRAETGERHQADFDVVATRYAAAVRDNERLRQRDKANRDRLQEMERRVAELERQERNLLAEVKDLEQQLRRAGGIDRLMRQVPHHRAGC